MEWETNLDIHSVLDYYKEVSYMCAYLSRLEDKSSNATKAMKQAGCEAYESRKLECRKMKFVGILKEQIKNCLYKKPLPFLFLNYGSVKFALLLFLPITPCPKNDTGFTVAKQQEF